MQEIVIHVCEEETWVAVLDEGVLVELYLERTLNQRIVGNIYRGKVENVLPGMQAAFVDIGLERNAFLYVDDALLHVSDSERQESNKICIEQLLQEGQEIVVQITKEPIGSKGARVTTHLTIPGRNLVLMPFVDYVGVSRRIVDEGERERLRTLMGKLKPEGMGFIVRTVAEGKEEAELQQDIDFLTRIWSRIKQRMENKGAPRLIYKDLDLAYRIMRDLYTDKIDRVTVDNHEVMGKILELLELYTPHLKERVHYFPAEKDILQAYGLETELEKALKRRVWLKSGGYLIIDQMEALTAIDVNTGKYVGTTNLADTVLKTNVEAAKEIARQLRLRNIGGIIIVDFIDMEREGDEGVVLSTLEEALKKDKVKVHILGLTQLGLLEMTRKKVRQSLTNSIMKQCPYCEGKGKVLSEDMVALQVKRHINRLVKERRVPALLVEVHPGVASLLIGSGGSNLEELERNLKIPIYIKGIDLLHIDDFTFKVFLSAEELERYCRPVDLGDKIIVQVEEAHISNPRDGISRLQGYVIDIEEAGNLVGQRVEIEIIKVFRTYAKARVVSSLDDPAIIK